MLLERMTGGVLDTDRLIVGGTFDLWGDAHEVVSEWVAARDAQALERLWHAFGDERKLGVFRLQVLRGMMFCGVDGKSRALRLLDDPHVFTPLWTSPESFGVLMGATSTTEELAKLAVGFALGDASRRVLEVAIGERVLWDGRVRDAALRAFAGDPAYGWSLHEWERGLITPHINSDPFPHPVYSRSRGEVPWPQGLDGGGEGDPGEVAVERVWGIDEEWDPVWPDGQAPPVGPLGAPDLYPNATTWCIEAWLGAPDDAADLSVWPFPDEHIALGGVVAQRVDARALLREWLWRGLTGGAYGSGCCVARAREVAWRDLARLADVDPGACVDDIAQAAQGLEVYGFRARGPSIEGLGGDFGVVAVRPDGWAFTSAHSDTD
jgi:hypothetical protein